jgi:fibronectin-binding autotransporter adhesin
MDWGNVTITTAMTLTLLSDFTCGGTVTIGSITPTISGAGKWTRTNNLTFTGTTNTLTLQTNLTITGTLTPSTATTVNGFSLLVTNLNAVGLLAGTSTVVFNSTGTWSGSGTIRNNTVINTTGTLTISGNVYFNTGTLTYTAGTVDSSGGTLNCTAASTLNTSGMSWSSIRFTGTQTLTSNLNVPGTTIINGTCTFVGVNKFTQTGTLLLANTAVLTLINNLTIIDNLSTLGSSTINTVNGFQIINNGGFTMGVGGYITGTTTILINGTGTWTAEGNSAIRNNTTINTTGTLTIVGNVYFNTGTLTYISGTVDSSGSTLNCLSATTLNTSGITWNNIYLSGTQTLTSNLNVYGKTSITGTCTFVGATRFTQTGTLELNDVTTLTLINNITAVEGFIINPLGGVQTMNGFQLVCSGGITQLGNGYVAGTTTILLNGTGIWQGSGGLIPISGTGIISRVDIVATEYDYRGDDAIDGIKINNVLVGSANYRGHNLVVVEPSTGTIITNQVYDTYTIGTATLAAAINAVPYGYLVLLSTGDASTCDLTLRTALADCGGTSSTTWNAVRTSQAFAGIKGSVSGAYEDTGSGLTNAGTSRVGVYFTQDGTLSTTLVGSLTTTAIRNNTVINTAGTITFSGTPAFNTGTLTYTAGTVVTTGSTLNCTSSTTLNTSGITWSNIALSGTTTLTSNLTVAGETLLTGTCTFVGVDRFTQTETLELLGISTVTLINDITVAEDLISNISSNTLNGYTVYVGRDINLYSNLSGTTNLVFNGTGGWKGQSIVKNNILIDTLGTITIYDLVSFDTGTLEYASGTVVTTDSTLSINSNATLDTNGIDWDNVSINGSISITINSLLKLYGDLVLNGADISFVGTYGWTAGTVLRPVIGTLQLNSGIAYTITDYFESIEANNITRSIVKSVIPGEQAILTLANTANQSLAYIDAEDIDSSAGKTIWGFKSTLINTKNWEELTASSASAPTGTVSGYSYTWVS